MRSLGLTHKIAIPLCFMLLLVIVMAVSALVTISIDQSVAKTINHTVEKQKALASLESHYVRLLMAENSYALSRKEKYRFTYNKENRKVQDCLDQLKTFELTPIEREEVAAFQAGLDFLNSEMEELFRTENATLVGELQPTVEKLDNTVAHSLADTIEELSNSIEDEVDLAIHRLEAADEREFWFIVIPVVLIVPTAIAIVFLTLTRISKPLLRLVEMAEKITMRDFSTRVEADHQDEVGILTNAFTAMAEEIERRYDELESFAYIVAHDLKSPIASIRGLAELLREDLEDRITPDEKDALETIETAAISMNTLVTELLEFARAGKVEFSREPVSINAMLSNVSRELQFYCKERRAKINVQGNLPSIYCDPIRFAQVWKNLIFNALKYNDNPEPTVNISVKTEDGAHRFQIEDNGIGIDPKDYQSIFLPFKRAATEKEYEGTGIGLAIVKRVVDFHRGKIWVTSQKGRGTTFYFTVPKIRLASSEQ